MVELCDSQRRKLRELVWTRCYAEREKQVSERGRRREAGYDLFWKLMANVLEAGSREEAQEILSEIADGAEDDRLIKAAKKTDKDQTEKITTKMPRQVE